MCRTGDPFPAGGALFGVFVDLGAAARAGDDVGLVRIVVGPVVEVVGHQIGDQPNTLAIVSLRTFAEFCRAIRSLGQRSISIRSSAPARPTTVGTLMQTSRSP